MSRKKRNRNPTPQQPAASAAKAPMPPRTSHPLGAAERREAQRQARLQQAKGRQRQVWLFVGGGAVALVALIVVLVVLNQGSHPGQSFPSLGRDHIPEGTLISQTSVKQYNSDPPTSGPHWPAPAPGGSYTATVPDERLVHSLEHGYIVIDHNCDPKKTECDDLLKKLDAIGRRYNWTKVIVNYRPQTRPLIALTAWTRLETLDQFDEGKIVEFIKAYRNNGPENAP